MTDSQYATIIGKPEFLAGGQAFFTVDNGKGQHFTFKISRAKDDDKSPLFASVLKGPDNWNNYKYIGVYAPHSGKVNLSKYKKHNFSYESVEYKTLTWAIVHVREGKQLPDGYSIMHAGKCCRCGRMLTNPDSIQSGIGPTCAGLSGM